MVRAQSHQRDTDRQGHDPRSTVQVQSGPRPQDLGSVPHAAGPYRGCPAAGGTHQVWRISSF